MKDLIKNDDAVSVVVGSILILAVLVTFMSVVTSSWVPVYEGNAESAHSDELFDTFIDLSKQIENAGEYPKSTTIKLGTDDMPFISNTNSVGHLEVNSSAASMTLTTEIKRPLPGFGEGDFLTVKDLNLSQDAPITQFTINFTLDTTYTYIYKKTVTSLSLSDGFIFELQSDTPDKIKIIIEEVGDTDTESGGRWRNQGTHLRIRIEYIDNYGNIERWGSTWAISAIETGSVNGLNLTNNTDYTYLNINLLAPTTTLELEYADSPPVTIDNIDYFVTNTTSLHNLTQYYMKQPDDGTYNLYYTTYDRILESNMTLRYNTTTDTIGGTTPDINGMTIGGGTLTLRSDYNFFVDQSYIYDSGAIILNQNDGAVFKVDGGPIYVNNDSKNNLILNLKTTVLQGDYQAGGNGIETIQTKLDGSYYASGFTNNVTITKNTTSELLYDLWYSYFSDLGEYVNTTTANCTDISNKSINQVGVIINSTSENILLIVNQKEIIVT